MATFNTTPGDAGANSYATVAEADDYLLARRLHVADEHWNQLGQAEKEAALMWATQVLDQMEFIGELASTDQALQWPRANAVTKDGRTLASDAIPATIKDAQAEIAHALVKETAISEPSAGDKFEKVKAGSVEVTFRDPAGAGDILDQVPKDVRNMLRRYLEGRPFYIPVMRA
jgi:hypothetical protein